MPLPQDDAPSPKTCDEFSALRVCQECGCDLCFESGAEPLSPEIWLVVAQCPNCWASWTRTVDDAVLDLFERTLDGDTMLIEAAVEDLAYSNERTQAELVDREVSRFAEALATNAILPMDF
jgi:hypothetical protein